MLFRSKKKVLPKEVIDFMDLGSGAKMERIKKMVERKAARKRRIEAIDLQPPVLILPSVTYSARDATARINELTKQGVRTKIINADNFFAEQVIGKNRLDYLQGIERCQAVLKNPIDPKLLAGIKNILVPNGRMYITTVNWHAKPLMEKLKAEGFEITSRPLTEKEALEGPFHTKGFYQLWKRGEFYHFFGKQGWELQRILAIKRT
jgi:hypothetical protein